MIDPLAEIEALAKDAEPVTTAIIAPEDHELMLAVKRCQRSSPYRTGFNWLPCGY